MEKFSSLEMVRRMGAASCQQMIELARECGATEERIAELCLPGTFIASGSAGKVGRGQLLGVDPRAEQLAAGEPTLWIRLANGDTRCLGAEGAFTENAARRQGLTLERAGEIVAALIQKGVLLRKAG